MRRAPRRTSSQSCTVFVSALIIRTSRRIQKYVCEDRELLGLAWPEVGDDAGPSAFWPTGSTCFLCLIVLHSEQRN